MESVGVRELKARASEIVEDVRSQHRRYRVTRHGRAVALLVPLSAADDDTEDEADAAVWAEMETLAAEIAGQVPEGSSGVEQLAADRR
jgi:prevent-host-death family protein